MREFIGVQVLVNTVSMLASSKSGAIWISDCDQEAMFYESKCAHASAMVLPAPQQAHEVLVSLKERGIEGILATVPLHSDPPTQDEFTLSTGDVTSLLVYSQSCMRVLEEIAGRSWRSAAEQATNGFRERVSEIAHGLQRARASQGIEASDRVGSIDLLTKIVEWNSFELLTTSRVPSSEELCDCGDDMLNVLSGALSYFRPRGISANRKSSPDELIVLLRAGYNVLEFEAEPMCWDLRTWQRSRRLPVLKEWRHPEPFGILLDQRHWEPDLERIVTYIGSKPMAVFKMDMDNFKGVNESLGHAGGDEAIRLYCKTVKEEIGKVAEVYRRGGDELFAIAPFVTPIEARERAEAIRAAVERNFRQWGAERGLRMTPTVSIGLIICLSKPSKEEVVAAADKAQLEAKNLGKNRVVEYVLGP